MISANDDFYYFIALQFRPILTLQGRISKAEVLLNSGLLYPAY